MKNLNFKKRLDSDLGRPWGIYQAEILARADGVAFVCGEKNQLQLNIRHIVYPHEFVGEAD